MNYEMTAKTFQGLEGVLAEELRNLGATNVQEGRRVVTFEGDLATMYRANLMCRTAIRVLKPFLRLRSTDANDLYEQLKSFAWEDVMGADDTFSIDVTTFGTAFNNSRFATYRIKDAIADHFTELCGKRPSVRLTDAKVRIDAHISEQDVTLSMDSSGEPLFKRGWRVATVEAPINEALAAGILLLSGWHGQCDLVDPFCGSGTFLVEAALIATNTAPGLYRQHYAFQQWADYDAELFSQIYNDDSGERPFTHKIYGSDNAGKAVAVARANVKNAQLEEYISVECRALEDISEAPAEGGVLVTNPPYGERLRPDDIAGLYDTLGEKLKHVFRGYHAWVIGAGKETMSHIGLKPSQRIALNNGGIDCELREYVIFDGKYDDLRRRGEHLTSSRVTTTEHAPRRPQQRFARIDKPRTAEEHHREGKTPRKQWHGEPRLGADKEVPIVHGRRKSWKRRDLPPEK